MGVLTQYGDQKFWHFGGTFDGLNKGDGGDLLYGPNADFIFPQDKQLAARVNSTATATMKATLTFHPTAVAVGQATGTITRKIGGAIVIYGQNKHWTYGLTAFGLNKKDTGQQGYWNFGNVDSDIFAQTQGGIVYAHATASCSARLSFSASARSIGQATPVIIRKINGASDPQGAQDYWWQGYTFIGLKCTAQSKFLDQTLWYFGLPTPDVIGTYTKYSTGVTISPAKIIAARMQSKRQVTNFPSKIKLIDPGMSTKRSVN